MRYLKSWVLALGFVPMVLLSGTIAADWFVTWRAVVAFVCNAVFALALSDKRERNPLLPLGMYLGAALLGAGLGSFLQRDPVFTSSLNVCFFGFAACTILGWMRPFLIQDAPSGSREQRVAMTLSFPLGFLSSMPYFIELWRVVVFIVLIIVSAKFGEVFGKFIGKKYSFDALLGDFGEWVDESGKWLQRLPEKLRQ